MEITDISLACVSQTNKSINSEVIKEINIYNLTNN